MAEVQQIRVPLKRVHVLKDGAERGGYQVLRYRRPEADLGFRERLATTGSVARDNGEIARLVHGALVQVEEGLEPAPLSSGVLALLAQQDAQTGSPESFASGSTVYEIVEVVRGEAGAALSGDNEVLLRPTNLVVATSGTTTTKKYVGNGPTWAGANAPEVSLKVGQTSHEDRPATSMAVAAPAPTPASAFALPRAELPVAANTVASGEGDGISAGSVTDAQVAVPSSIPAERIPKNYAAMMAIIGPEKLKVADGLDVLVLDLESRDLPRGIAVKMSELGVREVKVSGKYTAFSGGTASLLAFLAFLDTSKVKGKHAAQVQGFLTSELGVLKDRVAAPKAAPAVSTTSTAPTNYRAFSMGAFCGERRCGRDFRDLEPGLATQLRVVNGSSRAHHMFVVLDEVGRQSFSRTSLASRGSCQYTSNGVLIDLAFFDAVKLCEGLHRELAPKAPYFQFFFLEDKSKVRPTGRYGGGFGRGSDWGGW